MSKDGISAREQARRLRLAQFLAVCRLEQLMELHEVAPEDIGPVILALNEYEVNKGVQLDQCRAELEELKRNAADRKN